MDSIYVRVRTPAPRVAPRDLATRDLGPRVLNGCCIEAERADRVAFCLKGLRDALEGHQHLHPHLTAVIDELQNTSRLLRDLADKSQVHISQVPVMIDYLNVILPCLCRTLRDIMGYYEDKSMSKDNRWRTMYHRMGAELPGTTLPARFVMYNQFLQLLDFMLRRYVARNNSQVCWSKPYSVPEQRSEFRRERHGTSSCTDSSTTRCQGNRSAKHLLPAILIPD